MDFTERDHQAVAAIRALSIDAIEKANSGHPGLPLGAAPMAYVLWTRFLKHNPQNPHWFDRDRFVLSAGHGSMLLYSLLHLCGYDLPMSEIERFRQWGSATPGHPEFGHTAGVEATTGPLGQGVAMAVGMAMAERFLASTFNVEAMDVIDHYTYSLVGDGCLMEGVSQEAASLAGHLGLHKLIVLYDSNNVTLDGPAPLSFTEDVAKRFAAYGWNVLQVEDGNDLDAIYAALETAQKERARPTLIEVKTIIGYGAPNQGASSVHGAPLGAAGALAAKEKYGWRQLPFVIPEEVYATFAQHLEPNYKLNGKWAALSERYTHQHPETAQKFQDALAGRVRVRFAEVLPEFEASIATRDAFAVIINALSPHIPHLLGGSADLSGSNKTSLTDSGVFKRDHFAERNVYYGVREHAMGAALNGLALHGGVLPFAGTFLVFCDYLRPSIRLASLMKCHVIHIFTHDSIAVGEDGPTHEPIEQLAALRAIPGYRVYRPADATETALAVQATLEYAGPAAVVLTRQKLPVLDEIKASRRLFARGGYVLYQSGHGLDMILLASGSEVHLALGAAKRLAQEGVQVRVVSMPCLELFAEQDDAYRESVLPARVRKRLAVEMGHPMPWYRYVGLDGRVFGIERFGASAPGDIVMKEYGFTESEIFSAARSLL
ncbi:MAG: transketolase [Bacilli bacterium]